MKGNQARSFTFWLSRGVYINEGRAVRLERAGKTDEVGLNMIRHEVIHGTVHAGFTPKSSKQLGYQSKSN